MDIDVSDSLQALVNSLIELIPRILLFLVILLVGWLIAKLLEKAVDALLEKLGFDRLVERGGLGRAMGNSGYDPSSVAAKLVYLAVLLITLQLAFGVFGPNPISDLLASIVAWLPQAFVAIVIIVVAAYLAGIVRDLIIGALGGVTYGRFLAMAAYVFIIGLGVIAALAQIGVAVAVTAPVLIAVLATVAGIIIVGVGGGLVVPMRQRWERILDNAERDFSERERVTTYEYDVTTYETGRTEPPPVQPPGSPGGRLL
jgi:hypothetical protein